MSKHHHSEKPKEEVKKETAEPLEESSDGLQEHAERLRQEAAEYKEKYLRALADSENLRKRMQKEKQETVQYAVQNVLIDFLNPIDQFENALGFAKEMSDEVKQWAFGFEMILGQFKDALASSGATSFESKGKPFDPHHHEAVEAVPSEEHPEGIVIEESVKGYRIGDKTIRPARVVVSRGPAVAAESKTEAESND